MNIILDTHIVAWWLTDDAQMPIAARKLIEDQRNRIVVSSVTIWEMAIKQIQGKSNIPIVEVEEELLKTGFEILPMTVNHAVEYATIPLHHRDPFDRMLIAQSKYESAVLVTHDRLLALYGDYVKIV